LRLAGVRDNTSSDVDVEDDEPPQTGEGVEDVEVEEVVGEVEVEVEKVVDEVEVEVEEVVDDVEVEDDPPLLPFTIVLVSRTRWVNRTTTRSPSRIQRERDRVGTRGWLST
jgi:hypothetical protein